MAAMWIRCGSDVVTTWLPRGSDVATCGDDMVTTWIRRGCHVDPTWRGRHSVMNFFITKFVTKSDDVALIGNIQIHHRMQNKFVMNYITKFVTKLIINKQH